jgi:cytochrome c553
MPRLERGVRRDRDGRRAFPGARLVAMLALLAGAPAVGPAFAADIGAGKIKAQACVMCHGEAGMSQMPNAPHLAGQPAIYLVEQLKNFRSGKRPDPVMSVIAKPLTDTDIDDLAAWYGSIQLVVKPR